METQVTEQRLKKYFSVTQKALKIIKVAPPEGTHLHKIALDFLDMAKRYFNDAIHFREQGKWVNAFAALNYAHGWLDAGARFGVFEVQHNSELFTVD